METIEAVDIVISPLVPGGEVNLLPQLSTAKVHETEAYWDVIHESRVLLPLGSCCFRRILPC